MKVLVAADDSGSLKEVICKRGTDTSAPAAPQPDSITTICEESRQSRIQQFIVYQNMIIATRINGSICFYDMENNYGVIHMFTGCSRDDKDGFIDLFESFGLIYACTEAGLVTIINPENLVKGDKVSIDIKAPVSAFTAHPLQRGIFLFGGKENDVKIISLFDNIKDSEIKEKIKVEVLFQGKNVKNDKLDLRVPIWISKIMFLNASVKRGVWVFITVTRYGQIRKYDTSHGRKPISDIKISEKPLITLAETSEPSEIICSDTHVTTAKFDTTKGILIGKYKGAVGSIQALDTFLEGDLVATGGLDRYLRVFGIESREQIAKVYVGSQISCVHILEDDEEEEIVAPVKRKKRVDGELDSDEEELWSKLNKNENNKSKKQKV